MVSVLSRSRQFLAQPLGEPLGNTLGNTFDALNQLPRPFGPFQLIRLIAQGGMGQVFLALRPVEGEPDEVCVVKTVRSDLKNDKEAVGRFLDEARVVQKLDHGNICHTLDAGIIDKTYFLALEFISGRNLRDVQTRAQKLGLKLPNELIFHSIAAVLEALDYAHSLIDNSTNLPLGIVHRDVSPHNVMLGFDGYAKLIDFGLATHGLKRELTRPGIMVGKLRYNAPEQVRDRAIDGRSDLYSVGVMLYELVTGERFYEGLTEEAVWRVAMDGDHRPPNYDRLPGDVKNVLDLALGPEPEDRFPSAGDMRDAVLELATSRVVREGRRQSARFMSEIFAEERQVEREMILQATGLAEARTRVFDPNAKPSAESQESDISQSSIVGRTQLVSPAQIRGALRELMSGFDPEAETAMPQRPERESLPMVSAEEVRPGRSNPKLPGARSGPRAAHKSGSRGAHKSGSRPAADAETVVRVPSSSRSNDGPPDVFGSEPSSTAAAPDEFGRIADEPDSRGDRTVPAVRTSSMPDGEAKRSTRSSLKRRSNPNSSSRPTRSRDGATIEELPPLRDRADGAPSSAKLAAAAVMGGAVVLAIVAIVVVVGLKGKPPEEPEFGERDAGPVRLPVLVNPPDAGFFQVTVVSQPDAGFAPVVVDAGPGVVDAGFVEAEERPNKPRQPKQPKPKPPKEPREFKTFKESTDFLEKWCTTRVACAKDALRDARNIATLSTDETKALKAELPRCIAKCRAD